MAAVGHASNADILAHLRVGFPELSATTVHRLTARMCERGELGSAPVTADHAARFDSNLAPHDHFQCLGCDGLRDMQLPDDIMSVLQKAAGDCTFSGRLTIQGTCTSCLKKEKI